MDSANGTCNLSHSRPNDFLPADWSKIGCQDPNRWVELANQMKEVDVLPADFDPHQSYDTSFKKGCFN